MFDTRDLYAFGERGYDLGRSSLTKTRDLRRYFEQAGINDQNEIVFSVSVTPAKSELASLIAFRECIESRVIMANDRQESGYPNGINIQVSASLANWKENKVDIKICLVSGIPDTLYEYKALAYYFGLALMLFSPDLMASYSDSVAAMTTREFIQSHLIGDDNRDSRGRFVKGQSAKFLETVFNQLMAGDLTNLLEAPDYMISLVGMINPEVTAVNELHCSMFSARVDAAFAELDQIAPPRSAMQLLAEELSTC